MYEPKFWLSKSRDARRDLLVPAASGFSAAGSCDPGRFFLSSDPLLPQRPNDSLTERPNGYTRAGTKPAVKKVLYF